MRDSRNTSGRRPSPRRTGRSFTGGRSLPPAPHVEHALESVSPEQARKYARTSRGPNHMEQLAMAADAALRASGVEAQARRTGQRVSPLVAGTIGSPETLVKNVREIRHPGRRTLALGEVGRLGGQTGQGREPDIGMIPWGPLKSGRSIARAKLQHDLLDVAAIEHAYVGGDMSKTAEKYAVDPKRLAKHIKQRGQGPQRVFPADMAPEVQASARKITAALSFGGAKKLLAEQEALWSATRSERIGEALKAMSETPGAEGAAAAKAKLGGELPRLEYAALRGRFGDKEVQDLFTYISNTDNPAVQGFKKVHAHDALKKVLAGEIPAHAERALLYKTFGPEFVRAIEGQRSLLAQMSHAGLEIANIPRSLMASFDLSAPFRQGLVAGARHPVMFAKNFPHLIKSFGSERVYQEVQNLIHEDPYFPLAEESGISFTELGKLEQREEQFASNYAEHMPGEKTPVVGLASKAYNKSIGAGVHASGRSYVGFLNKMRMDMWKHHFDAATALKGSELNKHELESIATFINSATGRGDLGRFTDAAMYLNAAFFSPRLMASRFNFISPRYYAKLSPYARKEALKSFASLAGFVGSVLYLAKLSGYADVNVDPRNANFAKIQIGNTRIDIAGGFSQPIRLLSQLATGKIISSTTGDVLTLGPGYGHVTRLDILQRFFEGKATPTVSFGIDLLKGTNFQGTDIRSKAGIAREIRDRVLPLMLQDSIDQYKDSGSIPAAVGEYAAGSFGIGFQTYGPKAKASAAQHQSKLVADSVHYGLGKPPPSVMEDLKWVTQLDDELGKHADDGNGKLDYIKAVQIAAKITDARTGSHLSHAYAHITSHAAAHHDYLILRSQINHDYLAWNRDLHKAEDARLEATG